MGTLMPFLWDNYLELSDANEIFVLGVGRAYAGVKELLLGRSTYHPSPLSRENANKPPFSDCRHRLSGIVGFVTGEIYSVKSDNDEQLSAWYRSYARLYVANRHACWLQEDLKRKVAKRRFGDARRSTENELNEMMAAHAEEAQKWILDKLDTGDETTEDD
jgi:histone deacetylase 6